VKAIFVEVEGGPGTFPSWDITVMRIRDVYPISFVNPGSQILDLGSQIPNFRSRIWESTTKFHKIETYNYLWPKKYLHSSQKCGLGIGSQDLKKIIPDLDPESGSNKDLELEVKGVKIVKKDAIKKGALIFF